MIGVRLCVLTGYELTGYELTGYELTGYEPRYDYISVGTNSSHKLAPLRVVLDYRLVFILKI